MNVKLLTCVLSMLWVEKEKNRQCCVLSHLPCLCLCSSSVWMNKRRKGVESCLLSRGAKRLFARVALEFHVVHSTACHMVGQKTVQHSNARIRCTLKARSGKIYYVSQFVTAVDFRSWSILFDRPDNQSIFHRENTINRSRKPLIISS